MRDTLVLKYNIHNPLDEGNAPDYLCNAGGESDEAFLHPIFEAGRVAIFCNVHSTGSSTAASTTATTVTATTSTAS